MNRRDFLKYIGVGAGAAVAASALGYAYLSRSPTGTSTTGTTSTSSNFSNYPAQYAEFLNWLSSVSGPYAGQAINIAMEDEATPRAAQKRDIDFFTASHINSQYNIEPYTLELQDISLMVENKAPTYDIFEVDHQDVSFFKDHILSPTQLADMYPNLTYAPISAQDFQPLAWSQLATYPPVVSSTSSASSSSSSSSDILFIPFDLPIQIQYYRSDLYQAQGLSPAKTWDDYFSDVKIFNNSTHTRFGTACGAGPTVSSIFEFLNHLASFGGQLWQIKGTELVSALDSDQALAALENFVRLGPYADPASYTYDWTQVSTDLARSYAATALEWYDYSYLLEDPLRSSVTGNLGYYANPAGPSGSFSTYGGAGVGVSAYTKHPEAAWLWLQWATAYGTQLSMLTDTFHVLPTRISVLDDPIVKTMTGPSVQALEVAKPLWESNSIAALVPFPKWWNVLNIIDFHIGRAFQQAETPAVALQNAVQQIGQQGTLTF